MIQPLHKKNRPRRPKQRELTARLTFSPLAWLKLMYFLHAGDTEVGGFAISSADDLLYIQDVLTLSQRAGPATIELEDGAVADHFDRCVDAGHKPERFARIWWHTHPGASPQPSRTDEQTFQRVFGACDWSVMFIVSRTARTYARLALRGGPGMEVLLSTCVDWAAWPALVSEPTALRFEELAAEYAENVHPILPPLSSPHELAFEWGGIESIGDDWFEPVPSRERSLEVMS